MPFFMSEDDISSAEQDRMNKILNEKRFAQIIAELRADRTEMSREEAKFLVMMYYAQQEERIRSYARAEKFDNAPTLIMMARTAEMFEAECAKALSRYSDAHVMGRWMRKIHGIGPITSAGLLAFVNIEICNTSGKLWAYAGLTPTSKPIKGQKINYSPDLKKLCWKIGEGFVKVCNKEGALYGGIYKKRKAWESSMNEAGQYAEQAKKKLETTKIGTDTDAFKFYNAGMLPPAHIHARARRYAVKIFLSHLQQRWYEWHFKAPAPLPFAYARLGHDLQTDWIEPPALEEAA